MVYKLRARIHLIQIQGSSLNATCQTTLRATSKNAGSQWGLEGAYTSRVVLASQYSVDFFSRPVGSGKTALTLALCKALRQEYNLGRDRPRLSHRALTHVTAP